MMLTLFLCGILAQAEPGNSGTKTSNATYVLVEDESKEAKETWSRTFEPDDLTLTLYAISFDDLSSDKKETWYTPTGKRLKGSFAFGEEDLSSELLVDLPKFVAHVNLLFRMTSNRDDLLSLVAIGNDGVRPFGVGTWLNAEQLEGIDSREKCFLQTCHFEKRPTAINVTWFAKDIPWEKIYSGSLQREVKLKLAGDEARTLTIKPTIQQKDDKSFSMRFGRRNLTVVLTHREPDKEFFVSLKRSGTEFPFDPATELSLSDMYVDRSLVDDVHIEEYRYYNLADNEEKIELYHRDPATFYFRNIPCTEKALRTGKNLSGGRGTQSFSPGHPVNDHNTPRPFDN